MPVSRRISAQVKALQEEAEAKDAFVAAPPKSPKLKKEPVPSAPARSSSSSSSSSSPSPASSPSVQRLSFDGLEVTADTSLAGVSSARTRRRREAQKVSKAAQRKRKRSPTPSPSTPSSSPPPEALFQQSHPPTPAELHLIHNKREKRAIQRRVDRDAALVSSAVSHLLIEPPSSLPGISVDRTRGHETWRLSQDLIASQVDAHTAQRRFDLTLDRGPYHVDYTRNGKYLLLGGRRGHVSLMEWKAHKLLCEFDVGDEVRAVRFLHSHQMFAVAQRHSVYLYDNTGLELHVLPAHHDPLALDFLPYHFLLTSIGQGGWLKYHDTSTGTLVAQHRTRLGPSSVLTHNPRNAVSLIGHGNGVVTMWSPSMKEPLVRMLTQKAAVTGVAVTSDGVHMVTAGQEGQWKVWDCRMYRELHSYFSVRPVASLAVSQTGMVGLGYGSHVAVWRDALGVKAKAPYLVHEMPGREAAQVAFCPFEDSLAVGHSEGVASLLVPGAGMLAYDAADADPYETKTQLRERVVHGLLEKLQPSMIGLNESVVGMMDADGRETWEGERRDLRRRKAEEELKKSEGKEKMRGGQKSSKRWRRKRTNIIDAKAADRKEQREREAVQQKRAKERKDRGADDAVPSALDRFVKKR